MELIINSHGQWNNIDQCIFVNGEEKRISFVNMDTINNVLSETPYYLDCWTCLNGYQMRNNLTTSALSGQCVGAFSATAIISNNGVNCNASIDDMAKSNFYYFYYHYLKALNEGNNRSEAFLTAQQEYAEALIADSKNTLRADGNYQFNLYNLFAYHNFGLIEPSVHSLTSANTESAVSRSEESINKITESNNLRPEIPEIKNVVISDKTAVNSEIAVKYRIENRGNVDWEIVSYTVQEIEDGSYRFTLKHTAGRPMPFAVFNPPNGDKFMYTGTGDDSTIVFEISKDELVGQLTINIDKDSFFVSFTTDQLKHRTG